MAPEYLIEWLAVVFSVLYLILAIFQLRLCWIAQGIGALLYVRLMMQTGLYYEATLNLVYFILGVKGFFNWSRDNKQKIVIHTLPLIRHVQIIGGFSILAVLCYLLRVSSLQINLVVFLDSIIFCFSLLTTWMAVNKVLENWLYWVVIDALAVWVFWQKALYPTALLFLVYIFLALWGAVSWYGIFRKHATQA